MPLAVVDYVPVTAIQVGTGGGPGADSEAPASHTGSPSPSRRVLLGLGVRRVTQAGTVSGMQCGVRRFCQCHNFKLNLLVLVDNHDDIQSRLASTTGTSSIAAVELDSEALSLAITISSSL